MLGFLLAAVLGVASQAVPPFEAGPLVERVRSIDPARVTSADCEAQLARAATLNGPDLFYAASICHAANRPVEGAFLLNAGQNRSIADMGLIVPATRADGIAIMQLYGFIYSFAGGPGLDEVFRDAASRQRFFTLYDGWSPAYGPQYDPGWSDRRRPDAVEYQAAVAETKAGRRRQLSEIVTLYSDEEYYSLHRRLQELQEQTGATYVEGTPEAQLSRDLRRQMDARAVALGFGRIPVDEAAVEPTEARFPPPAPAAEEVVHTDANDPVVERCARNVEWQTIISQSRIAGVLITRSPEWGTIWRADLSGDGQGTVRFTCSDRTSSSRPLDMGPGDTLPPLPGG